MTPEYAAQISGWTYENEYSIYSFQPGGDTLDELLNGEYFAVLDETHKLCGYFCFGTSARIPADEPDAYTADALDMGLGMHPALCGSGGGRAFVQSGLAFAQSRFGARQIRLTVAAFNARAIRVYERSGFRTVQRVMHRKTQTPFQIMLRESETA